MWHWYLVEPPAGVHALKEWLHISNRFRIAQLILSKESANNIPLRLKVWQVVRDHATGCVLHFEF